MVEQDRELEDYLAGRSPVSRAYQQAPQEAPGAGLDARIREAARVPAKKHPRWLLPLSAAAAVLLAFTVLIEMQEDGLTPVPREKIEEAAPVAAPAPATGAQQEKMSAPAPARAETPPAVERRVEPFSAPQPFPATPESAADVAAPAAGAHAPSLTLPREREREGEGASITPEKSDAARGAREELETESPVAWIERIRRLRAAGDTEAAKTEYGKFRVQYPEHPLPEDLRAVFEVP